MWRVCKSSKIKHPGGSGGYVLETKVRPRTATHFSGYFTLSNHTPVNYSVWIIAICCVIVVIRHYNQRAVNNIMGSTQCVTDASWSVDYHSSSLLILLW